MSNVLSEEKQKQVVALGQLGWTLRRIEKEIGVRRETAAGYLRAAGVPVRSPGRWGRQPVSDSKPAKEVTTGWEPAKPANENAQVTAGSEPCQPSRSPSASACQPFHELIEAGLSKGRNAMGIWQDLVDDHGFRARYASVKRFVVKLRNRVPVEARVIITTAPGAVVMTTRASVGRLPRTFATNRRTLA